MSPSKPQDANDLARAGLLDDPFDGAEPMTDPAQAEVEASRKAAVAELVELRVGNFLAPALARMRARATDQERPIALPWSTMNDALAGGLWPGLHVLVGNTGTGKSQWALQAALQAARNDVPVLYIGLELGKVDLVARLVGLLTHRKWSRLFLGRDSHGKPSVAELDEVEARHGEDLAILGKMPFHLDVCPPMGWSYDELYRKARAMRDAYPEQLDDQGRAKSGSRPFLVVLDFLQLVASPVGAHEDLRERIGRAAYAGRAVARDLDAAVLLVSSTSRDNYGSLDGGAGKDKDKVEPGKTPAYRLVGLGKESGEVEYAADSVMVFFRDSDRPPIESPPDRWTPLQIAVAKARAQGDTLAATKGWIPLLFNGGRFREPREDEKAALARPVSPPTQTRPRSGDA